MKLSWTGLKISIAGARLSHLVQKDRIWDHGSMAEQARIIFHLVQKAKQADNRESLKKHCTTTCYIKITSNIQQSDSHALDYIIKEVAVIEVHPGKYSRPDSFTALISGIKRIISAGKESEERFSSVCAFVRQGSWWVLHKFKPG